MKERERDCRGNVKERERYCGGNRRRRERGTVEETGEGEREAV